MYNRYIPSGTSYTRIVEEDDFPATPQDSPGQSEATPPPGRTHPVEQTQQAPPPHPAQAPPESETPAPAEEGKKGGLGKLLKGLKLDDLDTGDILLLLIVLFLFLEGEDMELIITLGLLLILGL